LGLKLSALLGAAGVIGIAVGVASQKSLGNIISGFFMVTEKSFEIGDVITVGDKTGVVYSVELLSIMLKTFDNLLIRIPNETLISTDVVNITRFPIRRMDLFLSVSYDSDLGLVMDVLQKTARNNSHCLDEPNPFILIKSFEDSGISIQYGIWFEKTDYVETRNSIMQDLLGEFRKSGIVIPYPHITVKTESFPSTS
jgi:small-conductance mechanosensitive channel